MIRKEVVKNLNFGIDTSVCLKNINECAKLRKSAYCVKFMKN